jgi:hypothetical protein
MRPTNEGCGMREAEWRGRDPESQDCEPLTNPQASIRR